MTVYACPYGCGGMVSSDDGYCKSCRRDLAATPALAIMEAKPPGACWQWWGPAEHRMRCRKTNGHAGPHSTHNECGEVREDGIVCERENGHGGEHWYTAPPAAGGGDAATEPRE